MYIHTFRLTNLYSTISIEEYFLVGFHQQSSKYVKIIGKELDLSIENIQCVVSGVIRLNFLHLLTSHKSEETG